MFTINKKAGRRQTGNCIFCPAICFGVCHKKRGNRSSARPLRLRIIGVHPCGMVCHINDFGDLRQVRENDLLNALFEGYGRCSTSLAAAGEIYVGCRTAYVNDLDVAAVLRDRRVNFGVHQHLELFAELLLRWQSATDRLAYQWLT